MHSEILRGELILLPPPKSIHTIIADNLKDSLRDYVRPRELGRVLVEAGYRLFDDHRTCLQPDVSFLSASRIAATSDDDHFQGAPEIAIEIISPSESASDVEAKNSAYLEAGAKAIISVFPKTRRVHVVLAGNRRHWLVDGETLSLPEILPGWEIPVAEIFGR
ncbi:MAG: Uma2 family endonuclease [Candidatus Solibacter usitatus]|nr:Uma2 family endonuclease [Candidatus Solibacter usitatus]